MITGSVNSDLEALVRLTVTGGGSRQRPVDAVVDTGFTGFLTLRPATITALQLTWLGREQGTLADGSVDLFDVYRASVMWDGQPRPVEVEAADVDPLVGMALLERHSLVIEVRSGGAVSIKPLP
jgi:clan AA aspartic protease